MVMSLICVNLSHKSAEEPSLVSNYFKETISGNTLLIHTNKKVCLPIFLWSMTFHLDQMSVLPYVSYLPSQDFIVTCLIKARQLLIC